MIHDLDLTLKALLESALPGELAKVNISFLSPDAAAQLDKRPMIDLFLYDVRQNLELRDNEWWVERKPDGTASQKPAPVQVSCFYLISVWSSAEDPTEDEHHILGEILKVLLANAKIPPELLQGSLQGLQTAVSATPVPATPQNVTDMWQAFGGKPKAALNYVINVGVEVTAPEETRTVTWKRVKFELMPGSQG